MRTIDRLIKYKFTHEELCYLERCFYINGCGGKGGFKFSKLIPKIKKLFGYNDNKFGNLINDVKTLCGDHDIEFSLGGGIKDFLKANYDFVCGILSLLHWTNSKGRILIFLAIFIPLNVFGIKYFSWGKKKNLSYLFKDYGGNKIYRNNSKG